MFLTFSGCYCSFRSLTRLVSSLALTILLTTSIEATSFAESKVHEAVSPSDDDDTSVNLLDFGAVGDGISDDGPAFQSALDALANAGGGTLFVPAGSYLVATPVYESFSDVPGVAVIIQGVPSDTMPAPPTASGYELTRGLDLTSHVIVATENQTAFTITNLQQLLIEHVDFTGRPDIVTDALITLHLVDIDKAAIRHCEFYALSSFAVSPELGAGNIVRAVRSDLAIELTVFLGCTANSGTYGPVVQNIEWKRFTISNAIFADYGQRPLYGKMEFGSPLSWINIGNAEVTSASSARREFVVRDTFLDEGGWVGISGLPYRWDPPGAPIDLVYISGLKMNVSNFGTDGNLIYDVNNLLIENSHYSFSHNANSAIDIHRVRNAIFDNLTCIDHADSLRADADTGQLTVVNSEYTNLESYAQITNVLETEPDEDPVQYVRQRFISILGRQPDPASHFYWSDLFIKCSQNEDCLNEQRATLNEYLSNNPEPNFSISGSVTDELGAPLIGVTVSLTGSQTAYTVTDIAGDFGFTELPTSGSYTVSAGKRHFTFITNNQTIVRPAGNVTVDFQAVLNRHTIRGRVAKGDGSAMAGITVALNGTELTTVSDANGEYAFPDLPAGANYAVVPLSTQYYFHPAYSDFQDLDGDGTANFVGALVPELMTVDGSDTAFAFDSVNFVTEPFPVFTRSNFSSDGLTRISLFARNLESVSSPSEVSVVAENAIGTEYPLAVEHISDVADQSWLKQVTVKLMPNLPTGCYIHLRLSVGNAQSNKVRLLIAAAQ